MVAQVISVKFTDGLWCHRCTGKNKKVFKNFVAEAPRNDSPHFVIASP